jgi:hypothetical protein
MKALELTKHHLLLVGSEFEPWLRYTLFFAFGVGLGIGGWQFLTREPSQLHCRRVEPAIVSCTFIDRKPFRTEVIELPNNSLYRVSRIYEDVELLDQGLEGQIALKTRNHGVIVLNPTRLGLGSKSLSVQFNELYRFLPNPATGEPQSTAPTLTVNNRREWGPLFFLSLLSLLIAALAGFWLLLFLLMVFWLDFLIIGHIDKRRDRLTVTRIRLIRWQRHSYPLQSIIKARKTIKPRQTHEHFAVMLRRFNNHPLSLSGTSFGLAESNAQQIVAQLNEFLATDNRED